MAQCKQTAIEFIKEAFSPMVSVLCSHDAEQLCQKNNLSFVEMIQPFCRLTHEAAHIRDPGNIPHTLHNLRIIVKDMNGSIPQPTLARKMMSEAVANTYLPSLDNARGNVISVGTYDLQLSASTPWFESYREMFLQVAYPSEHEFLNHFLACVFVVSSSHVDPMDQFQKLAQQQHQQQHQSPNKLPKWFSPNILKFYVLMHDVVEGEEAKAEAIYQGMKSTYGANNCHLLQINSRSAQTAEAVTQTGLPDPWSQFLPRKVDYTDSPEDNMFPNQSSSDGSSLYGKSPTTESVETAAEATEEAVTQSSDMIDHPLAQNDEEHYTVPRMMSMSICEGSMQPVSYPQPSSLDLNHPHQHGMCLTVSDHDRLRIFIHEFIVRGLIPWAERTMRVLNEQLMSRKGIHRSFFSATKKWFGSNKAPTPPGPTQNTTVVYTQEAPELQMRRYADLAFMFQQYELAYQSYHSVKRDFQNDHAWLHYGGAIELASIAIFMQGTTSQRQYPHHYMESAISTYLNTCRSPQFATRATLLCTEALKSKNLFAEAAMQFIKMTSEDSDLRSALLLEQAAHCFINMKVPMVRKYAFHMILAGHRFSKAGQRRHALRSYSQALQVYKGKAWTLAEDHINFTIGRQSLNLKQLDNAASAFRHLLIQESKQTPVQQNAFLREYLFVYKQLISQMAGDGNTMVNGSYPQLPLPSVDGNNTKVLISGLDPDRTQDNCVCATSVQFSTENDQVGQWDLLEQHLVASASGGALPKLFRPTVQCYTNSTNNSSNPVTVITETVFVEVLVQNPLKVSLVLSDVHLLWKFLPVNYGEEQNMETPPHMITNERESKKNCIADEIIDTQVIPEIILAGCEKRPIRLCLTPHNTGELQITGVAYSLGSSAAPIQTISASGSPVSQKRPSFISTIAVHGKQSLEVQGPRLNNTKQDKTSKTYGPDRRLDLIVAPKMPLLDVRFYNFPQAMLCGEVRQGMVQFENKGQVPLNRLKVASTNPEFFTFGVQDSVQEKCIYQTIPDKQGNEEYVLDKMDVKRVVDIPIPNGVLNPGASVSLPMWIRGPTTSAIHRIDFLFYYQSVEKNPKLSYRLLHHSAVIDTTPALSLTASAQRGTSCDNESGEPELNTLVVGLELENLNQVHDSTIIEFSILQVSCASQKWALQHLSTRKNTDIKINPKEKMIMSFKAKRCTHKASAEEVVFTNVTFDQHQVHSAATPCADFYFRSQPTPPLEAIENQIPKHMLPTPAPSLPTFEELEEALYAKMTLVAIWKAFVINDTGETLVLRGQHHIALDTLNCEITSPPVPKLPLEQPPVIIIKEPALPVEPQPDPAAMTQLIKYTIECSIRVTHDFALSRVCVLPVMLVLHNCSDTPVKIEIDTKKSTESPSQDTSYRHEVTYPTPCDAFTWLNQTSSRSTLEASGTLELKLLAGFCLPGVYNLSTVKVQAGVDGRLVRQKPPAPALVIVASTSQPPSKDLDIKM
ncbi:trafficking protein particle complex subunit 8-like isoform X2 [Lineus longissimus]|uniref:trafficking protein particle complex subunit 8-like isoform X2 n=1 Tax=Lineus longissimus TaxID=88925 RepID=UPI00315DF99F